MSKDIVVPRSMSPRLRCAIDFVSNANNAEELNDKITAASKAIEELTIFIKNVKVYQAKAKRVCEIPFATESHYISPEDGPNELVVITANLEKPWVAVDEALEKTGISRTDIITTEYSYVHDEEKGRLIECRMTLT
jgi:hypothetical protein|nr:MAG TPA: hypothetical protein [Siphoviridae sp. cttiG1]